LAASTQALSGACFIVRKPPTFRLSFDSRVSLRRERIAMLRLSLLT
jgi:hypothetical protein